MSQEAARPPHSWGHILFGLVTFTFAGAMSAVLISQYVQSRPVNLLAQTEAFADEVEKLLLVNQVPRHGLQRHETDTRRDEGALWGYH